MMHSTGVVTISLEYYEELQRRSKELDSVKLQLETEKGKTWELFGNFFMPKTRKVVLYEEPFGFNTTFVIEPKNPTTRMLVNNYDLTSHWDLDQIYKKLIEQHIMDVVKSVDNAKNDVKRYP